MNDVTAWYLGIGREKTAAGLLKTIRKSYRAGSKGKKLKNVKFKGPKGEDGTRGARQSLKKMKGLKGALGRGAHWAGKNPGKALAGTAAAGATGGYMAGEEMNKPWYQRI